MKKNNFFYLLIGCLFLLSCNGRKVYFNDYQNISENEWSADNKITFQLKKTPDTPSDIFIYLRNNNQYLFSNIFLIAEINNSDKSFWIRDTLEYAMADAKGNWLGVGLSNVKENKLWWKESWIPPSGDSLSFSISHAMRKNGNSDGIDDLKGIIDVGISIELSKNTQ